MKELFEIQQRLVSNKANFNEFGKFNYRSLENILADVKPLLNELKCTITFTDDMVLIGERYYVKSTVTLENESGEKKDAVAFAREDASRPGMSESQVTGTASSYARKYAICSLLAINEEQDPDGMDNNIQKVAKKHIAQVPQRAAATPQTVQTDALDYVVETEMDILKKFYKSKFYTMGPEEQKVFTEFKDFYKAKIEKSGWKGGNFSPDNLWLRWKNNNMQKIQTK